MTIKPASEWGTGPGIYADVPEELYHGLREVNGEPVVSNSILSHLKDCPARAKYAMDEGFTPSASMRDGTLIHAATLEPMEYAMRFARAGTCNGRTNEKKRCSKTGQVRKGGAWYCNHHIPEEGEPDKVTRVTLAQEQMVDGVGKALKQYPPAKKIFDQPGGFEVSLLWKHDATGLWVRNRVDFLSIASRIALDVKKTKSAAKSGFEKSVSNYGYHRQGALYRMGFRALGLDEMDFVFLAVEDNPPYICAARRLTDAAYETGRREIEMGYVNGNGEYIDRGLLTRFSECLAIQYWPGYEPLVGDVGVTEWYERNLINAEIAA